MHENDLIYLPVDNVKFNDLYDWAEPLQRSRSHNIDVAKLQRQKSLTKGIKIDINSESLALFRIGDDAFALEGKCPHAGGPLYLGDIEELPDSTLCVRCPWHSWRFDLSTGVALLPSRRDIHAKIFPVHVSGDGSLHIGFRSLSPAFFSDDF